MRKAILFLFSVLLLSNAFAATSPHGKGFKMDCAVCHSPVGWQFKEKDNTFNHNKTGFPLRGQHNMLKCRQCHTTLVFSEVNKSCISCHKDMHQGTVGPDCERCHNTQSWIVKNIRQVHQRKGFALVGAHATADCNFCHHGASQLRFENLRSDCAACHQAQYDAAIIQVPNRDQIYVAPIPHKDLPDQGDKKDCYRCHNMVGRSWSSKGKGFEHGFFPLKGGHAAVACVSCHWGGFNPPGGDQGLPTKLSPECSSCHSSYRGEKVVAAHATLYTKFACSNCHTVLSWNNVKFKMHDSWFKISSGDHKGVGCLECHNNDETYKANCRRCHNFDR